MLFGRLVRRVCGARPSPGTPAAVISRPDGSEVTARPVDGVDGVIVTLDVHLYRLWAGGRWDCISVKLRIPKRLSEIDEIVESMAAQQAWIDLLATEPKPYQIGRLCSTLEEVV